MEKTEIKTSVDHEAPIHRRWIAPRLQSIAMARTANDPTSFPSESGVMDPDLFSAS